jgi:hypothetical protein
MEIRARVTRSALPMDIHRQYGRRTLLTGAPDTQILFIVPIKFRVRGHA